MGVGGPDHHSGQRNVGALSQLACHQMGQHRRPAQQVALHDDHGCLAAAQVQHTGPQSGAKTLAVGGVGRVAGLGHPRRRSDVHLGGASQQRAAELGSACLPTGRGPSACLPTDRGPADTAGLSTGGGLGDREPDAAGVGGHVEQWAVVAQVPGHDVPLGVWWHSGRWRA